ncbi:Short-chain dehydrogenase/reductase family 16C member [Ooceraea biroi]|nr:Short-chain dehydrogenase/reductase family 16C member [Ooceraea biroi]
MAETYNHLHFLVKILQFALQILYYICESVYYNIFINRKEKSVSDEIVLVTGAGHGIGKELAIQYANLNATVVCLDVNEKTNENTMHEIKKTVKSPIYAYTCDVSNRENVFEVAKKIKAEVGDVTILINNAGIMPCHRFLDQTVDQIKRTFEINIMAHIWMLQAYLPSMIEKNHGHIVALSSIAGLSGVPYIVPYCATKYAIRGLMEALNDELRLSSDNKSLIKFTTIFPYMVDTGLCKNPKVNVEIPFTSLASPKRVAAEIIKGQRQDIVEKAIPWYWLSVAEFGR